MNKDPRYRHNNSRGITRALTVALMSAAISPIFSSQSSAEELKSQGTGTTWQDIGPTPGVSDAAINDIVNMPAYPISIDLQLASDSSPSNPLAPVAEFPGGGESSPPPENTGSNGGLPAPLSDMPGGTGASPGRPAPIDQFPSPPGNRQPPSGDSSVPIPGRNEPVPSPPSQQTPPSTEPKSPPPPPPPPPPTPSGPSDPNPDFTFPARSTREELTSGGWCYLDTNGCHHDYPAADLGGKPGTLVVAPVDGKVIEIGQSGFGNSATIRVQGGSLNGNIVFLQHMAPGSVNARVKIGDVVQQGQEIGVLATSAQKGGTPPALHIDMLPPNFSGRVNCAAAECTKYPFINVQPLLLAEFNAGMPLPQQEQPAPPPPPPPSPPPAPAPQPTPTPTPAPSAPELPSTPIAEFPGAAGGAAYNPIEQFPGSQTQPPKSPEPSPSQGEATPAPPAAPTETAPSSPPAPEVSPPAPSERDQWVQAANEVSAQGSQWTNQGIALAFLIQNGFSPAQASGLVGNFMVESPGVNPATRQYGGGPGFGIAQWEGARKTQLIDFAAASGRPADDLMVQLEFVIREFSTTESSARDSIMAAPDASTAARLVRQLYERPNPDKANEGLRVQYANETMSAFNAKLKG